MRRYGSLININPTAPYVFLFPHIVQKRMVGMNFRVVKWEDIEDIFDPPGPAE